MRQHSPRGDVVQVRAHKPGARRAVLPVRTIFESLDEILAHRSALKPPRARERERERERERGEGGEGGTRGREGTRRVGETWGSTIRYRCPLTGGGSAVNHGKACANKAWSVCHRDCRLQWEHRVETVTGVENGLARPPGGGHEVASTPAGSHLLDWELTRGYFRSSLDSGSESRSGAPANPEPTPLSL